MQSARCGKELTTAKCSQCGFDCSIGEIRFLSVPNEVSIKRQEELVIVGKTLVSYNGNGENVTIPSIITSIGGDAFNNNTKLQHVTLPNGLKTIEGGAFGGCRNLKNIVFPNTLTTIGPGAFGGCVSLKSLDIPGSVRTIKEHAFASCESLERVDFQNGVTTVDLRWFSDCKNLNRISIPDSVIRFQTINVARHTPLQIWTSAEWFRNNQPLPQLPNVSFCQNYNYVPPTRQEYEARCRQEDETHRRREDHEYRTQQRAVWWERIKGCIQALFLVIGLLLVFVAFMDNGYIKPPKEDPSRSPSDNRMQYENVRINNYAPSTFLNTEIKREQIRSVTFHSDFDQYPEKGADF